MNRWVFVVPFALALDAACGGDGDRAGAHLSCYRDCAQRKSSCVVAATNAAELELCERRQSRCTSECEP